MITAFLKSLSDGDSVAWAGLFLSLASVVMVTLGVVATRDRQPE